MIRRAKPEEAQALTELALRSKRAWGYDEPFMQRVMPDMIVHPEDLEHGYGLVAEEDGVMLGYAIVRVDGRKCVLRDLFIEPEHFRKGIGARLFGAALHFAREQGARELTLEGDPNATGFYERMGMREIGRTPSIGGQGRTLPVMAMDT